MAKDLILDVIARKNSKELSTLADEFDRLAAKSDAAGKSFGRTTTFSQHLDAEVAKTKTLIRDLGQEFEKTGNKDVFAKLRGAQGNLSGLEKIKKQLGSALKDVEGEVGKAGAKLGESALKDVEGEVGKAGAKLGESASVSFADAFQGGLTSPAALAAIGAGVVVLGPAIAGAISASIPTVGIGAGIALAIAGDPALKAAGGKLGHTVLAGLENAASSFDAPLQRAVAMLGQSFQHELPAIRGMFDALAPAVDSLSSGVSGFLENFIDGFSAAAIAAKPLIDVIGKELPQTGRYLGDALQAITSDTKGAERGLRLLFATLDAGILLVGGTVSALEHLADALNWIDVHTGGKGLDQTSKSVSEMKFKVDEATTSTVEFNTALQLAQHTTTGFNASLDTAGDRSEITAARMDRLGLATNETAKSLDRAGRGIDGVTTKTTQLSAESANLGTWLDRAGRGVDGASTSLFTLEQGLDRAGRGIDGTSSSVAQLDNYMDRVTHHADGAGGSVANLNLYLADAGHRADGAATGLGNVAASASSASVKGAQLKTVTFGISQQFADAVAKVKSFKTALDELNGVNVNLAQAQDQVTLAIDNLDQALKQNGATFDANTVAGANNREAFISVQQAAEAAAQATYDQTGSVDAATKAYQDYIARADAKLRADGASKAQIDALNNSIAALPKLKQVAVQIPGLGTLVTSTDHLKQTLYSLNGKTFRFNVSTTYRSSGPRPTLGGPAIAGLYAHGGIRRAAVGMVLPPTDPGVVLAAEPQTGGEALIPRRGIADARGLSLADTAASWYGGRVDAPGWGGARSGPGGGPVDVRITVATDRGEVLKIVRSTVRGGGGNLNVVLNPRGAG